MAEKDTDKHGLSHWAGVVLRVVVGYGFAVIIATIVTIFGISLAESLPNSGIGATVSSFFQGMGDLFPVGAYLTAITAWPGYVLTIILALRRSNSFKPWQFALAGFLTSVQAIIAFGLLDGGAIELLFELPISIPIFIGGAVAGFVYGFWHTKLYKI